MNGFANPSDVEREISTIARTQPKYGVGRNEIENGILELL